MNKPIRNYDKADLQRKDLAHHLPAQADYGHIRDIGGSKIITRANNCSFWDIDGKEYLDGMAGLWCVGVGYGRTELADVAPVSYTHLDVYKRQILYRGSHQGQFQLIDYAMHKIPNFHK